MRMDAESIEMLNKELQSKKRDMAPIIHAKWEDACPMLIDGALVAQIRCSCCKTERLDYFGVSKNYCPNCGAKMDKED